MDNNEMITDGILFRYLRNEVSEQERDGIEQWLISDDNRRRLEGLKMLSAITSIGHPADDDIERAWHGMKHKALASHLRTKTFTWKAADIARLAAILLLCMGAYIWIRLSSENKPHALAVSGLQAVSPAEGKDVKVTYSGRLPVVMASEDEIESKITGKGGNRHNGAIGQFVHSGNDDLDTRTGTGSLAGRKKEQLCNNTLCPLEICIRQSLACDGKAGSVAFCSLLMPEEAGALHYRSFDKRLNTCEASVQEITITRVNTGETIVLNDNSEVTAQDFFDYITGEKTGNVVAGIFESDCNNYCSDQSIKLDNRLGVPILQ